jgi:hypothetical protein
MDDKTEIDEMKWALERQLGWIQSADTKLTILVPVPTAMLGISWVSAEKVSTMSWSLFLPLVAAVGLLGLSLVFSAFSVIPRTDGPASSNIFFGKIAQASAHEYRAMVGARTDADYLSDLAGQVHINAEIAAQKHGLIRKAMYCLFIAIAPWLATLYYS